MAETKIILGIDEVGRGPWAGPLVVGAVILGIEFQQHESWQKLADSKQLTAKKRTELAPIIEESASACGLGWVTSTELDRYGMTASLKLATRRAVKEVLKKKIPFDEIIIDGTSNFLVGTPLADRVSVLKKADSLIKEVSAASIIAKVARDDYMIKLAQTYPGYGFEQHMGYGTAKHQQALKDFGPCPEHRRSFRPIQAFLETASECCKNYNTTTSRGKTAEDTVRQYLERLGHQIIAQNYRTKAYEIDLVSTAADKIYFTEVKYSRNTRQEGTALVRVTPQKQRQMAFAAQSFLSNHPEFQHYQPLLAAADVEGDNYTVREWFSLS